MKKLMPLVLAFICSSWLCSCVLDEAMYEYDDIGIEYRNQAVNNDSLLNSAESNGTFFNGTFFNGTFFNGTFFNGVTLIGTEFVGTEEDTGDPVSGLDFVGATMVAELSDSSVIEIRIDAITESGTLGLNFYTVTYYDGASWVNICTDGVDAIPLPGTWNETTGAHTDDGSQFTFACRGAALAKCAEWGYRPGEIQTECHDGVCVDQDMGDFHLACVRMVRADYCGDGTPHTENGTLIDMWDAVGNAVEDTSVSLPFEAEWTADGAGCIEHTRWEDSATSTPAYDYIQAHCPSRWVGPSDTTCGGPTTDFNTSVGLGVATSARRLFRNKSDNNLRSP